MSVTVNAGEAETVGEPDEGKLHVRFDEGRLGTDRVRGLWRTTRRWVTAGERSSALNPVPHQPPTPQPRFAFWERELTWWSLAAAYSSAYSTFPARSRPQITAREGSWIIGLVLP